MDDTERYGLASDGVNRRRDLGNFTIAGDFKCSRCMHSKASISALDGVACRLCGNGQYIYGAMPMWMGRAVFNFKDGRREIQAVDFGRPRTWRLVDRDPATDNETLRIMYRTFERRDWVAGYGFIGPTRDAEYHEH